MHIYNEPYYVPPERYQNAIDNAVSLLRQEVGVRSIYQLGSAGTPGISDIDLLVVFEDGIASSLNVLDELSKEDRYLFTHVPFGISTRLFQPAQHYTLYHNYRLLWGESLAVGSKKENPEDLSTLKGQIALEFMIANFISKTLEHVYNIMNLRSTLLSVHALQYDLDFLNITSGPFYDLVFQLIEWRSTWFEKKVGKRQLERWFRAFYPELKRFIEALTPSRKLFLPDGANRKYARRVWLEPGETLGYTREGFVLPSLFALMGTRYKMIQSRLNTFRFTVPMTSTSKADILENRFVFLKQSSTYNSTYLKAFSPLSGNLGLSAVK